jgi:hypothetical protein
MHVNSSAIFSQRESQEWIVVPGVGEAFDSGDKATTKAITSAIKYIWMKTFLISDGQDIEIEQGDVPGENNLSAKPQSNSRTKTPAKRIVLQCDACQKAIKDGTKLRGKLVKAMEFAEASIKAFGRQLCGECAQKAAAAEEFKYKSPSPGSGKPVERAKPEAKPRFQVDADLIRVQKRVLKKGTPNEKTVYDLHLFGGLVITDWHESHYKRYETLPAGKNQVVLIYDEKKNGEYVNRSVVALLELNGEPVEDKDGEPIETQADQPDETAITDEDIPF